MPARPEDSAERIFDAFLARLEDGEQLSIDDLLASNQERKEALEQLWSEYLKVAQLMDNALPHAENREPESHAEDPLSADPIFDCLDRLREIGALARFSKRKEIGSGAMGVVHKVRDPDLRRSLAMKVLRGSLDEASGTKGAIRLEKLARFLEEAQVTGQLDHPGIVPVHELGIDPEGRPYFTMKLVRGRDFKQILEFVQEGSEEWTQTRALGVLLRICEAMAYAHEEGVVHRDLKPANIRVGRLGEVYVMDWGLARVEGRPDRHDIRLRPKGDESGLRSDIESPRKDAREADSGSPLVTWDGDRLGTPYYMPPEQARGALERIGPRSDVYAVGAMLYHLLTGRPPYHEPGGNLSTWTILARVVDGPPKPIRTLADKVPAELEAICEMAMAREASDRFADMVDMASNLRAYLEGRVVEAHQTGAVIEFSKWVRRNRGMAAALAAIVVLVGGSGFVFTWQEGRRVSQLTELNQNLRDEQVHTQGWADITLVSLLSDEVNEHEPTPEGVLTMQRWMERLAGIEGRRGRYEAARDGTDTESLLARDTKLSDELPRLLMGLDALAEIRSRVEDLCERSELLDAPLDAEAREAWVRVRTEMLADPQYEGLGELAPQRGLVPLGAHPTSGFQEFWHVLSGERPDWNEADARWSIVEGMGVVLVLLPGGPCMIGSPEDEVGRNQINERLHEDVLDPFFLSKYELTQDQWGRLALGSVRPNYPAGLARFSITALNPMESVSWYESMAFANRLGLVLPSEVEWEYACRGGSQYARHWGPDPSSLEGKENVADASFLAIGGPPGVEPASWDDGYPVHAPVGVFAINAFGLYDMLGNVAEWTRSAYHEDYGRSSSPVGEGKMVVRGGAYYFGPEMSRAALRVPNVPSFGALTIGIRLARKVER